VSVAVEQICGDDFVVMARHRCQRPTGVRRIARRVDLRVGYAPEKSDTIERRPGKPRQQSAAKIDPPTPILSRFRSQNPLGGCSVAVMIMIAFA
jgi:hypothetical protein